MKKILIAILIIASLVIAKPKTKIWNGVARCVDTYLDDNLKDPESLKIHNVSEVVYSNGKYYQRVNYSARNGFGGKSRSNKVFIIDKINGKYKVIWCYDFKKN